MADGMADWKIKAIHVLGFEFASVKKIKFCPLK